MSDNSEYAAPVPRAVREQAERAEQLARELGAVNVPDDPSSVSPGGEGQEGGDGTPPSPPEEQEYQEPPDDYRQPVREPDSYEQRYRTLQGKYDREMGELRGQLTSMQHLIATMNAAPPPPSAPPPYVEPMVTQEDREMWGDELPGAVSRWVGNAQEQRFRQLEADLHQLRGGQQRHDTTLTQHSVMAQLDMDPDLAGRWRALNENTEFHNWLSEADPFSGRLRMELLREAYAQGDAHRTGYFFRTYLAEHTAPPARPTTPIHTGQNGYASRSAGSMRLEDLAAPGRASGSGTNGGASQERGRMWTNREIGAFYRDVQRGVFRGRDADKTRIEQDIITAASEGRVTQ